MSVSSFAAFLDSHPDIANKVASCATYDQVAEIAKSNGFNLTGAELTKFAAETTVQLNDEELEAVAGGSWQPDNPPLTSVNPVNPNPVNTSILIK